MRILFEIDKNGGTYAYKDIAFEFASWVSPQFKLYLINEFERLKKKNRLYLDGVLKENWQKLITGYIQMQSRLILFRRNLHHSKPLLFMPLKLMC